MSQKEEFLSRWGMVLAALSMAVGTGNIWRFPRIAATHGGGSFLVAWLVFLLIWSVPLIILEFSMGKRARRGVIGAFSEIAGPKLAWMGGWVALCATAIMFYYSVVTGWCLRYLWAASTGELERRQPQEMWDSFAGSPTAAGTHVLSVLAAAVVVWYGVRGIERVAKVLMPLLFLMVAALALRAVTLPGAEAGLEFLFRPNWADLAKPDVWLHALTQNAWDTGAGWGLILTYAIYMRAREDVALNGFLIGFGNNSVSLLAGIMVLCTIFAINPAASAQIVGANNEGITFIWMPQLFAQMPAGGLFMVVFFLALSVAALTSLIAMLELATRVLIDAGLSRATALLAAAAAGLVCGLPSALSMGFFRNQDWVWGVGLMLSGLFFSVAALRYGVERLRREVVNADGCDLPVGRWWTVLIAAIVPLEAVVLMVWWLVQARGWDPAGWLDPWKVESAGTVLAQWIVALVALLFVNRWLVRRASGTKVGGAEA